jgi:hypothetical protein
MHMPVYNHGPSLCIQTQEVNKVNFKTLYIIQNYKLQIANSIYEAGLGKQL